MALPDYVRVRLANGSHVSMPAKRADQLGLKPLKQPGLNRDGTIRPAKHRTALGGGRVSATNTPTTEADASESKED